MTFGFSIPIILGKKVTTFAKRFSEGNVWNDLNLQTSHS